MSIKSFINNFIKQTHQIPVQVLDIELEVDVASISKEIPDIDLTQDEWTERHAKKLAEQISIHLKVWQVNDASGLKRMIMTSVRNAWPIKFTGRGKPLPFEDEE